MRPITQPRDVVRVLNQLTTNLAVKATLGGGVREEAVRDYAALVAQSAVALSVPIDRDPNVHAMERFLVDVIAPRLHEIEEPWLGDVAAGTLEATVQSQLKLLERVYQEVCFMAGQLPSSIYRRLLVWRDDLLEELLALVPAPDPGDDFVAHDCPVCGPRVGGHAQGCPRSN